MLLGKLVYKQCILTLSSFLMCIISMSTVYSSKLRHAALQSLYTLARESPEKCKWEEYFKTVLIRLMDLISDNDNNVRVYSLRVLREMLKTDHERLKDYAELTTMKVLKAFADTDSVVSVLL